MSFRRLLPVVCVVIFFSLAAALFTSKVYDVLRLVGPYLVLLLLVSVVISVGLFLAGLVWPGVRAFSGLSLGALVVILGLELWVQSFMIAFELLGKTVAGLSSAVLLVGVVPAAFLAAAVKIHVVSFLALSVIVVLFIAGGLLYWLKGRSGRSSAAPDASIAV